MTIDLSNGQPMEPEVFDRGNPARRCTAHRKNGDQCHKWAIQGGNVCATHGGRARQVVAIAKLRLMENADPAVKQLLKIAFDDNEPTEIRLKATLAAIDRAGLGVKTEVELGVTAKPFEKIIDRIELGSRSEFRRSMGIEVDDEPQPALPLWAFDDDDDAIIDVEGEVIQDDDDQDDAQPFTPDGRERGCMDQSEPGTSVFGPSGSPPDQGMMPLAEAVTQAAEMRKHAILATDPAGVAARQIAVGRYATCRE